MKIIKENKENVEEVVTALRNGAVLVMPTDTVYGLVCDANNEKAIEKIFGIKKRNRSEPLPIFVRDIEMAKEYAIIDEKQEEFLNKNWPGAVTVILESRDSLPELVTKNETVGMRMPKYDFLNLVLENFGKPLAQTSANISGEPATTEIKQALDQFNGQAAQPDLVVDAGDLPKADPSAIFDLTKNVLTRLR